MLFDLTESMVSRALESVENFAEVVTDLACLEAPRREAVVRLLADGVEVAAVAQAAGVASSIVAAIAEEEGYEICD